MCLKRRKQPKVVRKRKKIKQNVKIVRQVSCDQHDAIVAEMSVNLVFTTSVNLLCPFLFQGELECPQTPYSLAS